MGQNFANTRDLLMTYGWSILVVVACIGALAYFGVLDSSKLVGHARIGEACKEKCLEEDALFRGEYERDGEDIICKCVEQLKIEINITEEIKNDE